MAHWTDKYVGMEVSDRFDCADLAILVEKEVFGKVVQAPSVKDYHQYKGPLERFHAMADQVDKLKNDYAVRTDQPSDGDAILLITRGYSQHIGVYTHIYGEPWALHACDMQIGPQVVLQRVRDLFIRGIRVEGYYKWL